MEDAKTEMGEEVQEMSERDRRRADGSGGDYT